jgi:hypothetical protein
MLSRSVKPAGGGVERYCIGQVGPAAQARELMRIRRAAEGRFSVLATPGSPVLLKSAGRRDGRSPCPERGWTPRRRARSGQVRDRSAGGTRGGPRTAPMPGNRGHGADAAAIAPVPCGGGGGPPSAWLRDSQCPGRPPPIDAAASQACHLLADTGVLLVVVAVGCCLGPIVEPALSGRAVRILPSRRGDPVSGGMIHRRASHGLTSIKSS